jgi:hypothetical protein
MSDVIDPQFAQDCARVVLKSGGQDAFCHKVGDPYVYDLSTFLGEPTYNIAFLEDTNDFYICPADHIQSYLFFPQGFATSWTIPSEITDRTGPALSTRNCRTFIEFPSNRNVRPARFKSFECD